MNLDFEGDTTMKVKLFLKVTAILILQWICLTDFLGSDNYKDPRLMAINFFRIIRLNKDPE